MVAVTGCPSQGLEEQACGGLSVEIPLMVNKNSTKPSESLTSFVLPQFPLSMIPDYSMGSSVANCG